MVRRSDRFDLGLGMLDASAVDPPSNGLPDAIHLSELVDLEALQSMMEDFYRLNGMHSAVLDLSGEVLASAGRHDVCTTFHRRHPETRKHCLKCHPSLAQGLRAGEFEDIRCCDISSQGIALLWPRRPDFDRVAIELTVASELVHVTAKVVYSIPAAGSPGFFRIGCCFLSRE